MTDRVLALVERDTSTRIPIELYDFELPVLEAVHDLAAVSEVSRSKYKGEIDPQEAHDRLRMRFGDRVTLAIYPSARSLAAAINGKPIPRAVVPDSEAAPA